MQDRRRVIDMQHHYIPQEALKLAKKTEEFDFSYSIRRFVKAYGLITDIEAHLQWMEAGGVDVAILSTAAFAANGHRFCVACNDGYGDVVKRYPHRFKGMIHVFPQERQEKNRDEIKRCVEELGLWGIGIVSSYRNMTIDSPLMDHIYEMATDYAMPVFVHPTIRNDIWGGEKYDLYLTASREYDVAKSFIEIIYGVLPRYPELKVIMPHLAGGLPALLGRLLAKHQPEDIPVPEGDAGQWIPYHRALRLGLVDDFKRLIRNISYDTAGYGGWPPITKFAIETLGADHVCFGTDFPYDMNRPEDVQAYLKDVEEMPLDDDHKRRFFAENLKELFEIE